MIRKFLVLTLILTCFSIAAQRTNSSPYSFFGIGEQYTQSTVEQSSMGGIGVAFSDPFYLNFINPAANADLRVATYTFGLLHNDLTIKDNSGSQTATSTNLRYISLGFPIGDKAGFSAGFQPISAVGYSLTSQGFDVNGDLNSITLFSGNGGVNRLFGAFGIKVFDKINLGVEVDYAFGKIENNILSQRAGVQFATKYSQTSIIRGGSVKFGAQYKKVLKNDLKLDLGTTFRIGNNLTASGNERLFSLTLSSNGSEIPRNVNFDRAASGEFETPFTTNIGGGLGKLNKWYAGLEYEFRDAVNATGYLDESNDAYRFENASRISFGGFYIPKINSINSYFDRVTYRAGLRFENTGISVNGDSNSNNFTTINDFGISFGLGLPLGNRVSNLNLGFEYGIKGTTDNNLIQENYFNVRASLSLNAIANLAWCQKRKID